jgi:D-alanine-D-alanine ligase
MSIRIALVAGGYSGEYGISLQSADVITQYLDDKKYDTYLILITRDGWFWRSPEGREVAVDKNDFSLAIGRKKIFFDAVFIAIHGSPGEDGKLQGYFDMLAIPYTGCGAITAALTFNKNFCNQVVKSFGIVQVADSVHIFKGRSFDCEKVLERTGIPCFVKPSEGGSSIGMSRVNRSEDLEEAITKAFREDDQILVEQFICGREFTCGVYRRLDEPVALPVTEIISSNEFFDYEAKYSPGKSREITPAVADPVMVDKITSVSRELYTRLGCRGIVRIDYIVRDDDGALFFLEANTMPGQTQNSLVPQQVRAAGLTLENFYDSLIQECLTR